MKNNIKNIWHRLFLVERPSFCLSLFRIAVAATVGCHVLPTFCHLSDNYLSTAFKTTNGNFFTQGAIELVQRSPDWLVVAMVVWFCIFWFFFLIGLFSQLSCILMTLGCYYFFALNSFHVGTLSWDILLVTLFLMCVVPYHGDYFSMDSLLGNDPCVYRKRRPYFLQRLLQIQIGFTYFYTALYKITAAGNWLTDNPIYYLMNYPPEGVVKTFILKDYLMHHPALCYWIGILIVAIELSMVVFLFWHKTRMSAIYLGFIFHILLILTLDVPAIFFFLFPPQLLLFINPDIILDWIEEKRAYNRTARRPQLIYDGNCKFCRWNVCKLQIMDLFESLDYVDLHKVEDFKKIHPHLTKEKAASQIHLVDVKQNIYGGFDVLRRISFMMPMLMPLIPILFLPGMGIVGPWGYTVIAKNRYLFHFNKTCRNNACFRK